MDAVLDFLAHPVMDTIGLALLHFLWQGGLVGLVLLIALQIIPRANAPLRYNACVASMLLLLLLPLGTALQVHFSPVVDDEVALAQPNTELYASEGNAPAKETPATAKAPANPALSIEPDEAAPALVTPSVSAQVSNRVFRWRHALAVLWLFGLVFSSLRMLDGLITIWRLKRNAQPIDDPDLVQLFETVKGQLDITQPIAFKSTQQVLQPLLVGWLKPMVILPAGMLTGMAPVHIEAVLTHELIHVRRHDYLVLWLQSLLETLFFFHPVVWWISNQLRVEREYCTDAEAVAAMADKLTYLQALTVLEEQKVAWRMSLSAQDGRLIDRIRRLAGVSEKSTKWQGSWTTLIAVMIGCVMLFLACEAAYVDESKPAEVLFQEANELAREGQYGRAARVAEVAADKGDLCSIELLAELYYPRKGSIGINRELSLPRVKWSGESEGKSKKWGTKFLSQLEHEAEKGNHNAMYRLAALLGSDWYHNYSKPEVRNDSLAKYWMKKAGEFGHTDAFLTYGVMFIPKDSTEARRAYFKKIALAGHDNAYRPWAAYSSKYKDPRPYFEVARIAIDNKAKGIHDWIGKDLRKMEELIEKGNEGTQEWMEIADSLELRTRLAQVPAESSKVSVYPPMPFCPGTVHWRYPLGLE